MRTHAIALAVVLVACGSGGSGAPFDGSDGGTSDGGIVTDGGGVATPCPQAVPTAGTACPSNGQVCEIGGEGPALLCSTQAICANGKWIVNAPTSGCVGSQASNPGACPASFTTLADKSACPGSLTGNCVYPEGECNCQPCAGDGGTNSQWECAAYLKPSGCPETRPALGSACPSEGQSCAYGAVCSVLAGVPTLQCTGGVWTRSPVPGVACALRSCGL